jgi:hypothetical protein
MKKLILPLLALSLIFFYSKAQGQSCEGQVLRNTCPTEIIQTCNYDSSECPTFDNYRTGRFSLTKWERKLIGWSNGSDAVEPEGRGFCSIIGYCEGIEEVRQWWPKFLPPVVTTNSWRQEVIDQIGNCGWFLCPPGGSWVVAWQCSAQDAQARPFASYGVCGIIGGGGGGDDEGGGGGDGEGGGGCTSCNCYYQTVYTYTPTGWGECYHVYQREEYLCGGQIQWQSQDQYIHTCCLCEDLQ